MAQKQEIIINYHRNGKSHRQIAKALGISRTTVFKTLKKHKEETGLSGIPQGGILTAPKYNSSKRKKRALTEEIQQKIAEYLTQNAQKVQQNRAKQQLRAVDIHAALESAGHQISYTTVSNYVRLQKQKPREVFIRQSYQPGQAVEFDWGEVRLTIDGVDKRLMLAVFTSCYSNHRWARLFHRQDMSSFLQAHSLYFSFTRYTPAQMVYDNMRVAVAKFALKNTDKVATDDLMKLAFYYNFDYRFCNVRKGNEKGFVERSVEYIRRKSFALQDEFDSLVTANDHLAQIITKLNKKRSKGQTDSIENRFEQETAYMQPVCSGPYDAGSLRRLRIDKYSCIKVDTNCYSVPEDYPHKTVEVKIYPEAIRIYGESGVLAQHERRHTRFQYYLHLAHYLKTLRTKPGALAGAKSLKQANQPIRELFQLHFKTQPKVFIHLLLFLREKKLPIEQLVQAVDKCHQLCPHQAICEDKVKLFLVQQPPTQLTKTAESEQAHQIHQQAMAQLHAIQALFKSE